MSGEAFSDDVSAAVLAAPLLPDMATARAIAIARPVTDSERVALVTAHGRVLAQGVTSPIAIPPFTNSAMDGYAVRVDELTGTGPVRLRIAGRSAPGDTLGMECPAPMTAVRILTGAPVPRGFDAVIMQEHCDKVGDGIVISGIVRRGQNIRLKGEDVSVGARLVDAGDLLSSRKSALLAGAGIEMVNVLRKVRIGLVSTGSELRDPGQPLQPGQIYNSNRVLIRSMLADCHWAEMVDFGIVPDKREQLAEIFRRASESCDVIVSTGGVSAGDEDHVAALMHENGAELEILQVAMRPGKPLKVGRVGGVLFTSLPGNPNAALVTFCRIAMPAIRAVAGLRDLEPTWHPAVAGFRYAKRAGRTEFIPVRIGERTASGQPVLEMLERGSSASLSAMAQADGIAELPADIEIVKPGTPLRFELF